MQRNTQAAKEASEQEIKRVQSMMNKMSNKSGEKYTCLLTEFNLHSKGVQENNKLFFF